MTTFIQRAMCGGHRPDSLGTHRPVARPHLVTRLLRNREAVRFIVAPRGYGKAHVAAEYAQTIHEFNHVFWIEGRSPCFLRDLDKGVLARAILDLDPQCALVVFRDIPYLDPERAQQFAGDTHALLEHEVEVIVTCTPARDVHHDYQRHRDVVSSEELLLTPEELWQDQEEEGSLRLSRPKTQSIACLQWKKQGIVDLIEGFAQEDLASEAKAFGWAVLLLNQGNLDSVQSLFSSQRIESWMKYLGEEYQFLGIDFDEHSFASVGAPMDVLAEAFRAQMPRLAQATTCESPERFLRHCADALIAQQRAERGLGLMIQSASRKELALWLSDRYGLLLAQGCFCELLRGCERVSRLSERRDRVSVVAGIASLALGERAKAQQWLQRGLRCKGQPYERGLLQSLLLLIQEEELTEAQIEELERLWTQRQQPMTRVAGSAQEHFLDLSLLAFGVLLRTKNPFEAVQEWVSMVASTQEQLAAESMEGAQAIRLSLLLDGLVCVHRLYDERCGYAEEATQAKQRFEAALNQLLEPPQTDAAQWISVLILETMDRLGENTSEPLRRSLEPRLAFQLSTKRYELQKQRMQFQSEQRAQRRQQAEFLRTHPDPFRPLAPTPEEEHSSTLVPTLHVDLFGGLRVRIGDHHLGPQELYQTKVRTLLAVLVLNRGRELSRDSLVEMIWPKSSLESGRKNLSNAWSQLKSALKVGDGCPYLMRNRSSFWIDGRLLETDLHEFETLCSRLVFGRGAQGDWEQCYGQIRDQFSDELLPGEEGNKFVAARQRSCRSQLVDALIACSERLVSEGERQGALWFAREALNRDRSREDAYFALMQAQIAAGQRTGAIATFIECKTYLAEELGIDPSARILALYLSIIEEEVEV